MSLLPHCLEEIEKPFRQMEQEFFKPERSSNSTLNQLVPWDFFGPRFLKPWQDIFRPWANVLKSMEQMSINDVGTNITADDEKFQVRVDVQHFAPEEVSVKVVDGSVIVRGKHEEKRDDHGYVSREFVRKYALPKGCLPDTVVSTLSTDGVLTVTAPKVLPLPSTGERIVPIKQTGPIKKQIANHPV